MRRAWKVLVLVGALLWGGATGARAAEAPPEVLQLREAAWRAWFAGDEATLARILPPEFIGLNMAGSLTSRERTLADARAFRAAGGRLVSLEFPETQAQRYGDIVVLYGRYQVVFESEGATKTVTGRLTEMFVRQGKSWVHTGWHLDTVTVA